MDSCLVRFSGVAMNRSKNEMSNTFQGWDLYFFTVYKYKLKRMKEGHWFKGVKYFEIKYNLPLVYISSFADWSLMHVKKLKAMYTTTLIYIEICNVKGYDIFLFNSFLVSTLLHLFIARHSTRNNLRLYLNFFWALFEMMQ